MKILPIGQPFRCLDLLLAYLYRTDLHLLVVVEVVHDARFLLAVAARQVGPAQQLNAHGRPSQTDIDLPEPRLTRLDRLAVLVIEDILKFRFERLADPACNIAVGAAVAEEYRLLAQ